MNIGPWNNVAWGNDRFVAVGANGDTAHSRDGLRWQRGRQSATSATLLGITWGGDRFVAVGNDGTVVYSDDGEHWRKSSRDGDRWELASDYVHLADEHFQAVAWNGRRFVAVSYFDGTIMYSADGDRWEPASEIATFDTLRDIAWGDGRFVAVGWNGTIVVSP